MLARRSACDALGAGPAPSASVSDSIFTAAACNLERNLRSRSDWRELAKKLLFRSCIRKASKRQSWSTDLEREFPNGREETTGVHRLASLPESPESADSRLFDSSSESEVLATGGGGGGGGGGNNTRWCMRDARPAASCHCIQMGIACVGACCHVCMDGEERVFSAV